MSADVIGSDRPLTATQRALFEVVVDMIVPASADGTKPSAAEVGVLDFIAERQPGDLPAIVRDIDRLDAAARERHGAGFAGIDAASRRALVEDMRADDAAFLRNLAMHTVTCYYQDDRVLTAIGLEARPPFPKGYEVVAGDTGLLEPVRRRGSIVRDA
ncbi:MAG: gluconate 2-dehydrogenase subunit 3 family protein [Gammaproteobacteria bacterium]|nr:gluconate 2-dehydrogenase subunit 3 family protein [Gammaproteobacteria bacterium]